MTSWPPRPVLTSYLLVAQDQVPQKHWFALSRMLTSRGGDLSLMSWSGSMFEYLMPLLFLPGYENTLLDQACRRPWPAISSTRTKRHVPWGISESCYNAVDMNQIYQYRAFGVPRLGFKTGLADDLVIAPYATALALTVAPREACRNLQTLISSGFLGEYGCTRPSTTRLAGAPGATHAIVRSFMTHHQGMIMLSLAHVLLERPVRAGSPPTRWCAPPTPPAGAHTQADRDSAPHATSRWRRRGLAQPRPPPCTG